MSSMVPRPFDSTPREPTFLEQILKVDCTTMLEETTSYTTNICASCPCGFGLNSMALYHKISHKDVGYDTYDWPSPLASIQAILQFPICVQPLPEDDRTCHRIYGIVLSERILLNATALTLNTTTTTSISVTGAIVITFSTTSILE